MARKMAGFTLIEVIMVSSIVALLLVTTSVYVLPNLNRGRDSRRKADLRKIAQLLEEHYNDKKLYPTAAQMTTCGSDASNPLTKYQPTVPCEPQVDIPYYYVPLECFPAGAPTGCRKYRLLTTLAYLEDSDITRVGCSPTAGCGGLDTNSDPLPPKYNYGVAAGMTVKQ